jgi:hypothetical protein
VPHGASAEWLASPWHTKQLRPVVTSSVSGTGHLQVSNAGLLLFPSDTARSMLRPHWHWQGGRMCPRANNLGAGVGMNGHGSQIIPVTRAKRRKSIIR